MNGHLLIATSINQLKRGGTDWRTNRLIIMHRGAYRYRCSGRCRCRYIDIDVIFKNRAGVLHRDLKHEAIAECFIPDKAQTASFLNVLWNSPFNTLFREQSLEIYLS